jgi:hypothetical protein
LEVVTQCSILYDHDVFVFQQSQKYININTVSINMAYVDASRINLSSSTPDNIAIAGITACDTGVYQIIVIAGTSAVLTSRALWALRTGSTC